MITKEKIIEVSTFLFVENGVKTITIDRIVKQLHTSKRTIYNHFEDKTALEILIGNQKSYADGNNFLPYILLLIEAGAELNANDVFEELHFAIQNRIIEITLMKDTLFEKWTGRIAQAITDFTMDPFTNTSLQNFEQFEAQRTKPLPEGWRTISNPWRLLGQVSRSRIENRHSRMLKRRCLVQAKWHFLRLPF